MLYRSCLSRKYVIGSKVLVRLYDTELSERFLGSRYDLTLLEGDGDLIGLYKERNQGSKSLVDQ